MTLVDVVFSSLQGAYGCSLSAWSTVGSRLALFYIADAPESVQLLRGTTLKSLVFRWQHSLAGSALASINVVNRH